MNNLVMQQKDFFVKSSERGAFEFISRDTREKYGTREIVDTSVCD